MTLRVSVVIPTFKRPDWIKRAVKALALQTVLPAEVVPVARDTDEETQQSVRELTSGTLPFPLKLGLVKEPGFLPPVREGFRLAQGDVICVVDDDAEAQPQLLKRFLEHYQNPRVGAVGGRVINVHRDGRPVDEPWTQRVGYISWTGRVVGDFYKQPAFTDPVDVAFLPGGCMSFRRDVTTRLEVDDCLNQNVGFGYEMDLGLQTQRLGFRLVYDPRVGVLHYSAPRQIDGMRRLDDEEAVRCASYNETRIFLRRLDPAKATAVVGRNLLLGSRRAPGLLPWALAPLCRRIGFVTSVAPAAARGRVEAAWELMGSWGK